MKWSSNKKAVATVSKKGVVKAKKIGKAVITAKVGDKKLKCRVTVKKEDSEYYESDVVDEESENETTEGASGEKDDADEIEDETESDLTEENGTPQIIDLLKNKIALYGSTNSSGNKFVVYSDEANSWFTYVIIYYPATNELSFIYDVEMTVSWSPYTIREQIVMSEPDYEAGTTFVSYYYSMSGDTLSGNTIIGGTFLNTAEYNKSDKVMFYLESYSGDDLTYDEEEQESANISLSAALKAFDEMIFSEIGYKLKDIGFVNIGF